MSTHTTSPLESTVEKHIDSTTRLVRQTDLALAVLIVSSLIVGGLFLAVLADHWFFKEGLSTTLRFGIFAALAAAAGVYVYRKIVPIFLYPINPVYTAELIERDTPTFKNSLINWLLLRQEKEEQKGTPQTRINERMFDGMVRTAAGHVQSVPVGHAIDYRKLIWSSTLLAVLFLTFIVYAVFSPKNPFQSAGRVLFPFADIERPQAAQFRNVSPGDTTALQGETLIISAEVISQSVEPVYLVFSTDDGQAVEQRIPMTRQEGKIALETPPFPPGRQGLERGFNSSVDYWITQGESRSRQYRIDVLPAASIEIVSLRYDFPDYTGLPPEIIEHGGDVRALEGTTVTVDVRSTLPLHEIDIMFDNNPASRVRMTVDDQKTEAKGTFTLRSPFPYNTFVFQATDTNGNASRRSGIFRIEVVPDQPPRVQWADTAANLREVARIDLPLNETLQLPIQAEDPDFALRYLRFKTESPGKRIPDVSLLNSPVTGPTQHRGQISRTVSFSPAEKRLVVGDTAEIWAEAIDTKLPEANVSSTRRITVNVIAPVEKDEDQQQEQEQQQDQQNDEQNQEESQEDQADDSDGQDQQQGEEQEGESQGGDGESQQDEQEQEQEGSGQSEGEQQEEQSNDSNQNGSEPNDPNQGGEGNDSSEGEEQDGEQQGSPEQAEGQEGEGAEAANQQQGEGEGQEGESAEQQEQQRAAEPSPNHETQDGDAMERILEQMREEGKFDDSADDPQENQGERGNDAACPHCGAAGQHGNHCDACGEPLGSGQRQREDTLDPNSSSRSDQGSDASDPQQSPEGGEQNQSGDSNGEGTESGDSEGTESGEPGDQQDGSPQEGEGSQGEQGNQGETQQGDQGQGNGTQGEQPQGESKEGPEREGEAGTTPTEGTDGGAGIERETLPDDPNLEYAEKVTNLVLEYLEDQLRNTPSDELLDKLNWSEEQLRQFYERWNRMAANSRQPQQQGDGADFWREALRSLDLRPNQDRPALQRNQTTIQDDRRTGEGQRFDPPPTLRQRFQRYTEGIGR